MRALKRLPLYLFSLRPQFQVTAKDLHISITNHHTCTPASGKAVIGDTLIFHFEQGRHDVVQGTFDSPCVPADGGFWSGIISADDGEGGGEGGEGEGENGGNTTTFAVKVEDENPIWFFCSVGGHCGMGMVGVVNAL